MLLGISLWPQNTTWPALREAALLAERVGLDLLFAWDHFYAIQGDEQNPNLECWQLLAAYGAITERVRIGALVSSVTYRHPAVLTKMVTALDHVTNGRAIMGIGAGWMRPEHSAYGLRLGEKKTRSDRFEEAARIIRSMLRERFTTFEGKYYTVKDALNDPRPIQRELPILIGGGGEQRTLRTTALYADMWHGFGEPEDIAHKLDVLRRHCAKVGREPSAILPLTGGWVIVRDRAEEVRAYLARVTSHHDMPAPTLRASGDPDTVAERLFDFWRAGARGFVMLNAEPFDRETIERVGREVKPRLMRLIEG